MMAQVFLKAIEAELAGKFAHAHLSGWLHRIAHNLVIDFYRRRDRMQFLDLDEIANTTLGNVPQPHEIVDAAAAHDWLERATKCLTPAQATVIDLRNQGYKYDEIAVLMDKAETAVKALRHRALMQLRQLWASSRDAL